jgi:hypothetical protein
MVTIFKTVYQEQNKNVHEMFCYEEVLLRRCCVCRRFVKRRFVEEAFSITQALTLDLIKILSIVQYI